MTSIEKLAHVQQIDARIRAIRKELKDIPERKKLESSKLNDRKARVLTAENEIKTLKARIAEQALEAAALREKRVRLRQQQVSLRSNDEFAAMEREVEYIDQQIRDIEDHEIRSMERVEAAGKEAAALKAVLAEEGESVQRGMDELEERGARMSAELKSWEAKRVEAIEGLDPAWLAQYEGLAARRFPALVQLKSGICSGCNMKLPPSVHHDVRKMDRIVTCNFCGRMLCGGLA